MAGDPGYLKEGGDGRGWQPASLSVDPQAPVCAPQAWRAHTMGVSGGVASSFPSLKRVEAPRIDCSRVCSRFLEGSAGALLPSLQHIKSSRVVFLEYVRGMFVDAAR